MNNELLDPDMPADALRLHMGELNANEVLVARAAIRWANTRPKPQPIDVEALKRNCSKNPNECYRVPCHVPKKCHDEQSNKIWNECIDEMNKRGYLRTPVVEAEQLRDQYTSMGVTLAARNSEIEQLRKERDELAADNKKLKDALIFLQSTLKFEHPVMKLAKKVNE